MNDQSQARRYRFGAFEADAATGELRRQGLRVRINAQPFQVLLMLLDRPGELVAREQISRELWPDGTFVDYEHGVNSAINRIREALGDTAASPRFVETLARRGYRFVAPVERISERIGLDETPASASPEDPAPKENPVLNEQTPVLSADQTPTPEPRFPGFLANSQDLPKASHRVVQTLFVSMQFMYLGFYVGALANLAEIEDLFSPLPHADLVLNTLIVTAAIMIPVRAFVLCAVLFHAPGLRHKFLRIWPFLLGLDVLWALSPFLLLHHINYGLALACTTLLVYSPFAQRSLVLMGAGIADRPAPAAVS